MIEIFIRKFNLISANTCHVELCQLKVFTSINKGRGIPYMFNRAKKRCLICRQWDNLAYRFCEIHYRLFKKSTYICPRKTCRNTWRMIPNMKVQMVFIWN